MRIESRKNKVKELMKAGKPSVGTFLLSRSVENLEIIAHAGYDFAVIDAEHFMKNPETIENLIVTAEATGITPFVRIQENPTLIERALSAGARGIMVPMCSTKAIAEEAAGNGKYAPQGKRGICNTRATTYGATGLDDMINFFRTENDNILIMAQIETLEGLANLEEIASVPGIDMIFAGPMDLSHSMGITCDFGNPKLEGGIQDLVARAKKCKKFSGIATFNAEWTNRRISEGFDLVAMSCDTLFLAETAARELGNCKR